MDVQFNVQSEPSDTLDATVNGRVTSLIILSISIFIDVNNID